MFRPKFLLTVKKDWIIVDHVQKRPLMLWTELSSSLAFKAGLHQTKRLLVSVMNTLCIWLYVMLHGNKYVTHFYKFTQFYKLRRNQSFSSSRINKRTQTLYRGYLHCIANFCATVLNIFSKGIISKNTKRNIYSKWFEPRSISSSYCDRPGEGSSEKTCCWWQHQHHQQFFSELPSPGRSHYTKHQTSKTNFEVYMPNARKHWWNETEILPVFTQFVWTLKFVFSISYEKLFLVLFQATIYIFIS